MAANEHVRRSGTVTRAAVLDAAERLFAARGYRGTSLEEIGREAGLSRGTPGYFFGSKQRLYGAVLDRILARAETTLSPSERHVDDPQNPARDVIEDVVAAYVGLLASEPTLVRLIQWETLEGNRQILAAIGVRAQRFVELVCRLGTRDGATVDPTAATEIVTSVAAMCWFPFAHAEALKRTFGRDPYAPEVIAALEQTVVDFVRTRLAAARARP